MPGKKVVIVGEVYDPSLTVGYPLPKPPGTPEHPIVLPPEPPLGIWGPPGPWPTPPIFIPPGGLGPGVPTHPIVLPPEPPLGIWGPTDPRPTHPIVLPPVAPPTPGFPSHPIVIPPGSIDGVHPEHPIVLPPPTLPDDPRPTPPIYIPPGVIDGDHPEHPIYIPPGAPGEPAHPIVLPPDPPEGQPPQAPEILKNWDVKAYWTPVTGWGAGIFPTGEHPGYPTPSKAPSAGRK